MNFIDEIKQSIENEIIRIEKKLVKDRHNDEHIFLIQQKYHGSVRNYLLSMGNFKEVDIEEWEKE